MMNSAATAEPARTPLKLGILIVGSLIWDSSDVRGKWRAKRLNVTSRTLVSVPIRYGRRSRSRGDSYTMVFSHSLLEATSVPRNSGRPPVNHRL